MKTLQPFCEASRDMNNLEIMDRETKEVLFAIDFQETSQAYRNKRMRKLNKDWPINEYIWKFTP